MWMSARWMKSIQAEETASGIVFRHKCPWCVWEITRRPSA